MKNRTEGALFTMENARELEKIPGIVDARNYLLEIVKNHPTANHATKLNAERDIWNALTGKKLMFVVANYILAHENPALKVIR